MMSEKYSKYKNKYLSLKTKYELLMLVNSRVNALNREKKNQSFNYLNSMEEHQLPVPNLLIIKQSPNQLAILNSQNPFELTLNPKIIAENQHNYNNNLGLDFKITDQKNSGRCWIFATLNMIRFLAREKWKNEMDTENLEFSQSYLFFYEKYERYHRYLHYYIDINSINEPNIKEHLLTFICHNPLSDGGQWDMIVAIIKKYGIVPKHIFQDSNYAKNSGAMNIILTEMLKQDWIILSKTTPNEIPELIQEMMKKVLTTLISFLGKPPDPNTTFNWDFTFNKNHAVWENLTPLELLKKSGFEPDEWISVVNDPRKKHPYNNYYQIQYLGNVYNQHVGWLNVNIDRLKELTIKLIDLKIPVWVGCDVGACGDIKSGIHDPNINKIHDMLELNNKMSKDERLQYYSSVPSHAMVITAYHKENNIATRFRVENSWGNSTGSNGYLLFTENWFNEYVFQIVVKKDILNDEEKQALNNKTIYIMPWDPIGVLAC
jgi:bleomycin hydrolase